MNLLPLTPEEHAKLSVVFKTIVPHGTQLQYHKRKHSDEKECREESTCGLLIEPLEVNEKGEPVWPTKPPNSLPLQALKLKDRQPFK